MMKWPWVPYDEIRIHNIRKGRDLESLSLHRCNLDQLLQGHRRPDLSNARAFILCTFFGRTWFTSEAMSPSKIHFIRVSITSPTSKYKNEPFAEHGLFPSSLQGKHSDGTWRCTYFSRCISWGETFTWQFRNNELKLRLGAQFTSIPNSHRKED